MRYLSSTRAVLVWLLPLAVPAVLEAQAVSDTTHRIGRDTVRLQELEIVAPRSFQHLRYPALSPVDIVPLGPIARTGNPELTQILSFAAPSFQSVTQTQTDGNDHVDFAQLRGLGADQTLVLINGKRRHTSALIHVGDNINQGTAGVDLNSIPAAAIERIEVLRDGAAAQYGSDAIGGVINIVLKSGAAGGSLGTLAGVTSKGDGESVRTDFNYGVRLGSQGFLNLTAEYRHRQPTNRVGRWNGNVYFGDLFNFGNFGPNGEYNSQQEYQNDLNKIAARHFDLSHVQTIGDSKLTNATIFLNSAIPVGDSIEVYGFGGLTYRAGDATAFYRFPADASVSDTLLYPDGYLPAITSDIRDRALTFGVRGNRGGWEADLSNTFGANSFAFGVDHTLNASLKDQSPTSFQAGTLYYGQNSTRLDLSREVGHHDASWAEVALGSEFRVERYQISAGQEASWRDYGDTTATGVQLQGGSQGFPGFQPANAVNRSRRNIGAYVDLAAHLTPAVSIGAAGRYESYSDFGDRLIGKAALELKAGSRVTLHAGANTGFRAPSLHQLYTSKISTFFVANAPNQVGLFNNLSPVTRSLGVAPLKPERSKNVSAGITIEPVDRLRLSVDGYIVWVDDRILLSGVLDRASNPAIDTSLAAFPGVQSVQFFSNAADTRTRGLDVQASYPVPLGAGVLTLSGSANFNRTRIRGSIRTPAGLGTTPLLDPAARSYIETALPPSKIATSVRYATGSVNVLFRATRFGAVRSINLFGPNETVKAAVITDANVGYTLGRWELAVGANNLFNHYPARQNYANSYFGIFKYSKVTPYSIRGTSLYGSVTVGL